MLTRSLLSMLFEKNAIYSVFGFDKQLLPLFYLFLIFYSLSTIDCRQQDEELDELSASVERIGGVGLTIHEELLAQVRIF